MYYHIFYPEDFFLYEESHVLILYKESYVPGAIYVMVAINDY